MTKVKRGQPANQGESNPPQSAVSRLHLERDEWRSLAHSQQQQLISSNSKSADQAIEIARLEDKIVILRIERGQAISNNKILAEDLQATISDSHKLVDRISDLDRTIAQLRRSGRTKVSMAKRNLTLKAALLLVKSQATSAPEQSETNTNFSLMEALVLATQRVHELETKGEALLEALDDYRNRYDGEMDGDDADSRLYVAETIFQMEVDDDMAKEQKEHWRKLLDE
ncbi:hypothetical protein GQ44DRAFT_614039 [Phaeosphaeriaceae sp. PMI808]|nr:hypothetical protein GQ44DRAFT_614039 [Phaeosphaeriaceae sp. PMI808]